MTVSHVVEAASTLHPMPTVIVANFAESHADFLLRAGDPRVGWRHVRGEQQNGDRTILWHGDAKLVVTSFPVPHAADTYRRFGYQNTRQINPTQPTDSLSLDILREQPVLDALIAWAGPERRIQLIPYATTWALLQLADILRSRHGIDVLLPESPDAEALWVRDYVDTKSGFHQVAAWALPTAQRLLPAAVVARNRSQAAVMIRWALMSGTPVIAKPDTGENGIGAMVFRVGESSALDVIAGALERNPYFGDEPIVVERFIHSAPLDSPSLEIFVPRSGTPAVTYLCRQLFQGYGDFCGVLVDKSQLESRWGQEMIEAGLLLASYLQAMGYAGHFDLDGLIDQDGQIHLLELNARRTGGTHVHDFARFHFGIDYVNSISLLSNDAMAAGTLRTPTALFAALDDLLYRPGGARRGVIITVTSSLPDGEFGCIVIGQDEAELLALLNQVRERVGVESTAPLDK